MCDPIRSALQQSTRAITSLLENTKKEMLFQFNKNQTSLIEKDSVIHEKKEELTLLTKEYKSLKENNDKLKIKIDAIVKDLYNNNSIDHEKYIRNELKDVKCSLVKRIGESEMLNRIIYEKDQIINENDKIVKQLKIKLCSLEKNYDECKLSNITNNKKLLEMKQKISEQEQLLRKGENDNSYKSNYISNLENKNDDLKIIILGLESNITIKEKSILNLQEKLNTSKNIHKEELNNIFIDIERLKNEVKEVKSEHLITIKELEKVNAENVYLNYKEKSLKKSIRLLDNQLRDCIKDIEELKDTSSCYLLEIKDLKKINNNLNEELQNQRQIDADNNIQIKELNGKIESSQYKTNSVTQELDDLNCTYKELNEKYKNHLNNYDILHNSYTNCEKQLFKKIEELQSKNKDLSIANDIICGNELLISSCKRNLNSKNDDWKRAESDLQNCKIQLNEEISMRNKIQKKYNKLKPEKIKCSQDKSQYINNHSSQNMSSVPRCHEAEKGQTKIIMEMQSKLDNKSLEVER